MNYLPIYFLHNLVLADQGEIRFVKLLTYQVLHRDFNIQLVSIDSIHIGLLFPIRGGVLLAFINTVWSGLPELILNWCRNIESEDDEERLLQCLAYTKDIVLGIMVSKECFAPLKPLTQEDADRLISSLGY